jgi:predicted nucleic acid-binding protein
VVLVDSSIWIAEWRRAGVLPSNVGFSDIAICPPILQEVLQGVRDEDLYVTARRTLLSVAMLEASMSADVFEEAAQIYRTGRMTGFTIRSSYDCLIAACAIRNGSPLLHSDRDFNTIARFTRLQSRYVAL